MCIDFVTIYFDGDVRQLALQARSFARFADQALIGQIIVVNNDRDRSDAERKFTSEVLPEYKGLSRKVAFFHCSDIDKSSEAPGWRNQQYLKLMAANIVKTDHYIVLDAKNHFIRRIDASRFFSGDGRPLSHYERHVGSLKKYFDASLEALGMEPDLYRDRAMPATTPFVMVRDLVRQMLAYIEKSEKTNFERFFYTKNRLTTEFFLYYAFILKKFQSPELVYDFGPISCITLFSIWPDTREKFDWAARKLREDNAYAMGVHRNRLARMPDYEKRAVVSTWLNAGLITSADEAEHFLQ